MSVKSSRVVSLESRHSEIESLIAEEARRPQPDEARIATLKRQKLQLKDELAAH